MKKNNGLMLMTILVILAVLAGCQNNMELPIEGDSTDLFTESALHFDNLIQTSGTSRALPANTPYTLDQTAITFYRTVQTEYLDVPDEKILSNGTIVTLKNPDNQDLYDPDGGLVSMRKDIFWTLHLEGSGYWKSPVSGETYVINLITPDPQVIEDDPMSAEPSRSRFQVFSNVEFGLDGPDTHFGLVPWKSMAVNLKEYPIPKGSWVYIAKFDGLMVPYPKMDDLGRMVNNEPRLWNPQIPEEQVHFDWKEHDGWFQVNDISWSLQSDLGGEPVVDGKWVDIYCVTGYCWEWAYGSDYNGKKGSGIFSLPSAPWWSIYQTLEVYPYADNPVFNYSNGTVAKYCKVLDDDPNTTPVGDKTTKAKYDLLLDAVDGLTAGEFGDIDGQDDDHEMVLLYESPKSSKVAVYVLHDSLLSSPDYPPYLIMENTDITDIAVGDTNGNKKDEILILTKSNGLYRYEFANGGLQLLDSGISGDQIICGFFNNDLLADIAVVNNGQVQYAMSTGSSVSNLVSVASNQTTLTAADLDGNGVDEIIYSGTQGTFAYTINGSTEQLDSRQAKVLASMSGNTNVFNGDMPAFGYDPDYCGDIFAIFSNEPDKVYINLSSHTAGFEELISGVEVNWIASTKRKVPYGPNTN